MPRPGWRWRKLRWTRSYGDRRAIGVDADIRARAARILADIEHRERGDSEKAAEWLRIALDARREPDAHASPRRVMDLARV